MAKYMARGVAVDDLPLGSQPAIAVLAHEPDEEEAANLGTATAIAVPVGSYADLGAPVHVPTRTVPPRYRDAADSEPILRSPVWRNADDFEERKIRFLATLNQRERLKLWWRQTAAGKFFNQLPPCPSWIWEIGWVFACAILLLFVPWGADKRLSQPTRCGGSAFANYSLSRVVVPSNLDDANSMHYASMHYASMHHTYRIVDSTTGACNLPKLNPTLS